MFLDISRHDPLSEALVDAEGNRMTYGGLSEFAGEFGKTVGKRSLIAVLCRNQTASAACFYAAVENRTVPLLLGAKTDAELRNSLISIYRPEYIWAKEADTETINATEPGENAVCVKPENTGLSLFGYSLYRIPENETKDGDLYGDLSLLLSTSGSTGSPKLVRHSYGNLSFSAKAVSEAMELSKEERPLISLPMQYTYGLSVITSHLYAGSTLLLCDESIMKPEFWSFLRNERATSFTGVPYSFELLRKLRIFRADLPYLKRFSQGGGKMSEELINEFNDYCGKTGRKMYYTYGASESTARMSVLPPGLSREKAGSIGKAVPGGKLSLSDEGEIIYEGGNVTLGYALCRDDLKLPDERKGVLYTGDIGECDDEGYFYIKGRKSRFLKLFGLRIGLDECERILASEFKCELACTGTDDMLKIFFVNGNERKTEPAAVKTYLAGKLGLVASCMEAVEVPELPRNEAGKILYKELGRVK